jgi:phage terminase large subunit
MRDSLVAAEEGGSVRDPELEEAKRPCCTEEEPESYVWQQNADRTWDKERPVDENNHGLDCCRYMVAHLDLVNNEVQRRGRTLLKL